MVQLKYAGMRLVPRSTGFCAVRGSAHLRILRSPLNRWAQNLVRMCLHVYEQGDQVIDPRNGVVVCVWTAVDGGFQRLSVMYPRPHTPPLCTIFCPKTIRFNVRCFCLFYQFFELPLVPIGARRGLRTSESARTLRFPLVLASLKSDSYHFQGLEYNAKIAFGRETRIRNMGGKCAKPGQSR